MSVRDSDPAGSHEGARFNAPRASNQRGKLLAVYARERQPMIDFTAAVMAGLDDPGTCFWKRCSELREKGLITWARDEHEQVIMAKSPRSGAKCGLCIITDEGYRQAAYLKG